MSSLPTLAMLSPSLHPLTKGEMMRRRTKMEKVARFQQRRARAKSPWLSNQRPMEQNADRWRRWMERRAQALGIPAPEVKKP